ncbi:hypothetical protein A2U01_0005360 [Trifolium medium]|uniref:Uncharacterized protein n=1 Tax=Trifolium medium TaxID=97028 RepID=A0A392MCN8_9FABA|nr:hypothetical protein [Trifolium medium]
MEEKLLFMGRVKQFLELIDSVVVTHANDSLAYRFDSGGMYNVKSHYMHLYKKILPRPSLGRVHAVVLEKLGTVEGHSILMANISLSNFNKNELSAKGNHPTRAVGLLHLLCRFFGNGKSSFVVMSNCTRSLELCP